MTDRVRTLEDFPLHDGAPGPAREETVEVSGRGGDALLGASEFAEIVAITPAGRPGPPATPLSVPLAEPLAAPLAARLPAAAADAATVLLLTALAVLAARLATGSSPRPAGLVWVGAFVLFLSAFSTVLPLVAFGRTIGMAIADLSARSGAPAGVPPGAAFRRWLGTLATAGTGGLLLLWTARDGAAPTPADRLSGCALAGD